MDASIAQLVELLICNQWVGGSSPSAGSNEKRLVNIEFASLFGVFGEVMWGGEFWQDCASFGRF